MASAGFCYDLPAALSYLESEECAWEFAHGLMCALSTHVAICGMRGKPLVLIRQIADYCDMHREMLMCPRPLMCNWQPREGGQFRGRALGL